MNRIEKIIKFLNKMYKIKVWKGKSFDVLIGTVLSHRTKDEVSWPASERLFKSANNPEKMSKLSEKEIVRLIKPVGFYNQKAKRVKQICKTLLEKYNGKVPYTREELMELPGVGAKTASIVLSYSFGIPTIGVDTHVNKVSQRLGLVPKGCKPEKTQEVLEKIIPKNLHIIINHLFVTFGKNMCRAVMPHCFRCPVYEFCKYEKKEHYRNLPLK